MPVMAFWGSEQFVISPRKINPILNLSTSYKLKAEANNDTSGTPPTNTFGKELQPVKFDVQLNSAAGVDVRSSIERWSEHIGEKNPLYICGSKFGPNLLQLQEVSPSGIIMDDKGRMRYAVMGLSFMEFVPTLDKKAYTSNMQSGTGGNNATASQITATALDKSAKKSGGSAISQIGRELSQGHVQLGV